MSDQNERNPTHHHVERGPAMGTTDVAGRPVVELKGIGKDFGAIRALHGVDLQIFP
jgi:hypothetical protein